MYRCLFRALAILSLSAAAATRTPAQQADPTNWTQWGGPNRNFVVDVAGLAKSWPERGPKTIWRRALGEGYSPIAVDAGRLYTMYQRGEDEVVVAMHANSGATLWEYAYKAPITVNMSRAPGPRATPLVLGDVVYTVGATGKLHALNARTGEVAWRHDLFEEFKGQVQDEYYAASPLAFRNTIIVPVGAPGGSVMAFDARTGAVAWKALDGGISYASPILIDAGGRNGQQAVLMMELEVIGIDPASGRLLWRQPHKNQTRTNVSTPLWGPGNLLFCSSAYDSGSRVLELTPDGAATTVKELWSHRQLRVHQTNAIRIGDTVYGSSGDFGPTPFTAVNVRSGEVLWQQRDVPKSSFIYADGRFIMLGEDGELLLASPGAAGLTIHSRAAVMTATSWTPPSLAGPTLYLRDRKEVLAVDLR